MSCEEREMIRRVRRALAWSTVAVGAVWFGLLALTLLTPGRAWHDGVAGLLVLDTLALLVTIAAGGLPAVRTDLWVVTHGERFDTYDQPVSSD